MSRIMGGGGARAIAVACTTLAFGAAMARAAPREPQLFDIDRQSLAGALNQFAQQTEQEILFSPEIAVDKFSPGVHGMMKPTEALSVLLRETGLTFSMSNGGAILVRLAQAGPQQSQDVPSSQGQGAEPTMRSERIGEVVVTGSRIQRASLDTPIPVVSLDVADIQDQGHADLSEALLELPGVETSINLSNQPTAIQTSGLSVVDLRALGANRTLTLIDGRRTVSNSGTNNIVSVSTIPHLFVERIEVITGGASAVYGSDAIAGVVNVITQTDYEGLRVRAQGSASQVGGAEETAYAFAFGKRFLEDRLYMLTSAQYSQTQGLKGSERDFALRSVNYSATTNTLTSPDLSTSIPGGRFRGNAFWYEGSELRTNFEGAQNGFETRPYRTLMTPRETFSAALKLDFELTDDLKLFTQAHYVTLDTISSRDPDVVANTTTFGLTDEFRVGTIPRNNPFAPAAIATGAPSSGITFSRRLSEFGLREIENEREVTRLWAGLSGRFGNSWSYEFTAGHGSFEQAQSRSNATNLEALRFALNVEADPANPGQFRCIDAAARAAGCVPVNLFGAGSVTPQMADYIRADIRHWVDNTQDTLQGYVTGQLFDMPAGAAAGAFGFEYRRDETQMRADEYSNRGIGSLGAVANYEGAIRVKELFAELSAPLLRDQFLADQLTAEVAVRMADYDLSKVGEVLSYRGGLQWKPHADVGVRGQWGRAQRAPDITEVFSPPRDDFDAVTDICNGVSATTAGTIAENCRADPGIAAAIAGGGTFNQASTNVFAPNAGNPDLEEETADTLTVGLVYTPAVVPGLQLSVDYYDIDVKAAIDSLANGTLLSRCYGAESFPSQFCGEITRGANGQLTRILNRQLNLNQISAAGVDVAAYYTFGFDPIPGTWQVRINYSRRLKHETIFLSDTGLVTEDTLGEIGAAKHRGRASLRWENGPWRLQWTALHIGDALDDAAQPEQFAERGISDPLFMNVDPFWQHNASFGWSPKAWGAKLRVFGGVNNVFDKTSPFLPAGTISGSTANFSSAYDIVGREYHLGLQVSF